MLVSAEAGLMSESRPALNARCLPQQSQNGPAIDFGKKPGFSLPGGCLLPGLLLAGGSTAQELHH